MHTQIANSNTPHKVCYPRTGEPLATFGAGDCAIEHSACNATHPIVAIFETSPDDACSGSQFSLRNQQYSITAVTTSSGSVAERYAYTAYGQPTILDGSGSVLSSSAINNRNTYTGREWDATLGLYHFRARWMSGLAGRFMGRDPIGYKPGPSLYEFVVSGPLHFVDPDGLKCRIAIAVGHTWNIEQLEEKFSNSDGDCDYFAPMCCEVNKAIEGCKKKGRDILPGLPTFDGTLYCKASEKKTDRDRSVEEEFPKLLSESFKAAEGFCDPDNKCQCSKVEFEVKCHLKSERDNDYPTFSKCLDSLSDSIPFNPCRSSSLNGTGGAFFYDCNTKSFYVMRYGRRGSVPMPIDPRPITK